MTIVIMIVMVGLTGKLVAKCGFKRNLVAELISLTASLILFAMVPAQGTYWLNVLPASLLGA